jgi:hypothetical protein
MQSCAAVAMRQLIAGSAQALIPAMICSIKPTDLLLGVESRPAPFTCQQPNEHNLTLCTHLTSGGGLSHFDAPARTSFLFFSEGPHYDQGLSGPCHPCIEGILYNLSV